MATNRSYLTHLTEEETQNLIDDYKTCSIERLGELAQKLGYRNPKCFKSAMNVKFGVRREPPSCHPDLSVPDPIINIPQITIKPFKPLSRKGDPETQVLLIGDWHYGNNPYIQSRSS